MQIFSSIGHMYKAVSGNTVTGKLGITASAILLAYISPIVGLLVTCFAFTVTDLVYGIKVAKLQGLKITSEKGWKGTIRKMLDEFTIIFLARLLEFTILGTNGIFVLTGGVTIIIALTELWSILENLNTLNPKGPWRVLSKFLRKKGEDITGLNLKDSFKDIKTKNVTKDINISSAA